MVYCTQCCNFINDGELDTLDRFEKVAVVFDVIESTNDGDGTTMKSRTIRIRNNEAENDGMYCNFMENVNVYNSYGTSVCRQPIKGLKIGGQDLREISTLWVIQSFKDLIEEDVLLVGYHMFHMECMLLVFSGFIQNQLDLLTK